jgi:hypothetical protein
MSKEESYRIPVLCFGTFFTLLLREGVDNLSTKEWVSATQSAPKNNLTEPTAFLQLNRIVAPMFNPANTNVFKGQASCFKSCSQERAKNLPIVNVSDTKTFFREYNDNYSKVFERMKNFVSTYIHTDETKRKRLVKSLLELIRDDEDIYDEKTDSDIFYVTADKNGVKKDKLVSMNEFSFVGFLLGVFRFILEHKRLDNKKGEPTYEEWCPPNGQALRMFSDKVYVGNSIRQKIEFITDDVFTLNDECTDFHIANFSDKSEIILPIYEVYDKSIQDKILIALASNVLPDLYPLPPPQLLFNTIMEMADNGFVVNYPDPIMDGDKVIEFSLDGTIITSEGKKYVNSLLLGAT